MKRNCDNKSISYAECHSRSSKQLMGSLWMSMAKAYTVSMILTIIVNTSPNYLGSSIFSVYSSKCFKTSRLRHGRARVEWSRLFWGKNLKIKNWYPMVDWSGALNRVNGLSSLWPVSPLWNVPYCMLFPCMDIILEGTCNWTFLLSDSLYLP